MFLSLFLFLFLFLFLLLFWFWFWFWFLFLFLFLLLHNDGVVVFHLFSAAGIGVTALSVAVAVILGAIVPQVETKMAPMPTTVATTNEMCHGPPSTPPSDPSPREGKGNEGKGGGVMVTIVGGGGKDAIVTATINCHHC